jgi:hypothetical protein
MSDEKHKSRAWIARGLVLLALYVLSLGPAVRICRDPTQFDGFRFGSLWICSHRPVSMIVERRG